ncbi:MAG: type IV pilus assembly protein PilC [Rickettsiales bacterium]|jgi:type IV pilus assembly protein PilC
MNRYRYKAIDDDGKYVRGVISAESIGELEVLLKNSNLYLVSNRIEKDSIFGGKLDPKDLITIFTHLEQLDRAGVSIIDSISDIKNSSDSIKVRNLMQEVFESLKNGSLLSESFAKHPKIFPEIFVGLISNGEKTGNLYQSFNSIIDHIKWNTDMKRKTGKAIRYPLFSITVMMLVLGVMTTVVVPKVTEFLQSQDIELPTITVALINFSSFVQNNGGLIVLSIPTFIVIYKILNTRPSIAIRMDKIKLCIPFFGKIITKIDASRFCYFFSITFKSGLGVLECLEAAKTVVGNHAIKESIDNIKTKVSDGQKLAKAIESTGFFPSLVIRMFEVGENSGNMEDALNNIKFFYDREINDSVDKMVGMIQPILTLVMGGMMAWITIAVFGPIYSSFGNF